MAITGIDTIEGKQIIAAGATSAKYAGAAKSGNTEFSLAQVANTVTTHSAEWGQGAQAIPYTATSDSAFKTNSAIETNALLSPPGSVVAQYVTAGLTPSGVIVTQYQGGIATGYYTASTDGEKITLSSKWGSTTPRSRVMSTTHDYVYSGSTLLVDTVDAAITVKDNSAAWGGGSSYTGNVQEALDEVYTNSSDWNESYDTLTANSASWGTTYTGDAQGALDEVYTNSSKWNGEYYSASNPSAFVTNDELTAALTGKEDTLTFGYTDSKISQINGSAIYSQGGASYTGNVQEALDEVYTNSSNWNESYETLTANSASWGGDELPLSAGEGISLSVVDNKLVISDSGLANKEDKLTFAYTDSKISQINGSAIYSQGGTSYTGNVQEALDKVYTDSSTWDNVTAKQDKLTFSYDGSNNITGINSSAIAGSDVPEGVMVESGLEYNAVNEISGYNGSAIAQYGAEKQWLVHDDTLVHAANSAQYALGVNLSAVAQLLGVDETVLWTNSGGSLTATGQNFVLNESYKNFNKFKFCLNMDDGQQEIYVTITNSRTNYGFSWGQTNSTDCYLSWVGLDFSTDTTGSIVRSKALSWSVTSTQAAANNIRNNWEWTCRALTAIYGIGRKQ